MAGKGRVESHDFNFDISRLLLFSIRRIRKLPNEELANESRSTHITVAADMVFSLSHYLSGVRWESVYPSWDVSDPLTDGHH